ncbi:MAG: dihydrolipoyl dehydrogenase family protein [Gaiellales bacterium]
MTSYDLIVLGGGTAGSAAAKTAHDAGATAVMFNDGELGGLCILRGCMPTKTMLHAAHLAHEAEHPATAGVRPTGLELDFAAIMANKDAKVARFKSAKVMSIERGGYDVVDARARFVGPTTVEAAGTIYEFTKGAVIATGSVATAAPFPGLESVGFLTSDEVMDLTERPSSIAVVGSGATGSELAQFFARIGTEVSLLTRSRVGSKLDADIADELARVFVAEPNLTLHNGVPPTGFAPSDRGVRVALRDGSEIDVELLVMATGRAPNLEGLGLEAAGVEVSDGAVVAGPDLRTSNPNVFVAGDATGRDQLLHVANWEGAIAASNALDPSVTHEVEQRLTMEVIFLDPPLSWIGLSETEAVDRGYEPVVSLIRFAETGRAITMDVRHGISKLVVDPTTGELLGAQVLGPRSDDLVHLLSSIMYYRGTVHDMLELPWYHPTISEVFLSQARDLVAQVAPRVVDSVA